MTRWRLFDDFAPIIVSVNKSIRVLLYNFSKNDTEIGYERFLLTLEIVHSLFFVTSLMWYFKSLSIKTPEQPHNHSGIFPAEQTKPDASSLIYPLIRSQTHQPIPQALVCLDTHVYCFIFSVTGCSLPDVRLVYSRFYLRTNALIVLGY